MFLFFLLIGNHPSSDVLQQPLVQFLLSHKGCRPKRQLTRCTEQHASQGTPEQYSYLHLWCCTLSPQKKRIKILNRNQQQKKNAKPFHTLSQQWVTTLLDSNRPENEAILRRKKIKILYLVWPIKDTLRNNHEKQQLFCSKINCIGDFFSFLGVGVLGFLFFFFF